MFQIQQEQSRNKDTNGSCNRSNVKEILQILARNTRVSNDYTDVQLEKTRKNLWRFIYLSEIFQTFEQTFRNKIFVIGFVIRIV